MNRLRILLLLLLAVFFSGNVTHAKTQTLPVVLEESDDGWRLLVDGDPFMVHGMNWDYFPIGTNL